AHYVHLAAEDLTVLRFPDWEHRYSAFVSGPTIVARTDLARQVRFPDTTTGEDTAFLKGCTEAGARIYSATRFGFVQRRSAAPTHTWDISSAEILSTATVSHWGPPNETEVPGS
ncbi:MAG: glycosyltransferase, partial [Actinomyces sp.]